MAISRGSDVKMRVFVHTPTRTKLVRLWNPNSSSFTQDDNKERQRRLGTTRKPNRRTVDGHSGNLVFELEGPELHKLQDDIDQAYLDGQAQIYIDILRTDRFKGGGSQTYVYPRVVCSMDDEVSGQDDAVTVTVNFQSEPRQRLNA